MKIVGSCFACSTVRNLVRHLRASHAHLCRIRKSLGISSIEGWTNQIDGFVSFYVNEAGAFCVRDRAIASHTSGRRALREITSCFLSNIWAEVVM